MNFRELVEGKYSGEKISSKAEMVKEISEEISGLYYNGARYETFKDNGSKISITLELDDEDEGSVQLKDIEKIIAKSLKKYKYNSKFSVKEENGSIEIKEK